MHSSLYCVSPKTMKSYTLSPEELRRFFPVSFPQLSGDRDIAFPLHFYYNFHSFSLITGSLDVGDAYFPGKWWIIHLKKYLFIYLAAPGLNCSTWDL